ncbi:lactonase family protein [Thermomicrobiaceae bacterium CFH 74404]|uniref:Lactonase family protein n=1 Tax=Thermalbibacter longus TaxID=2951981 RepID=A0AA42BB64_9BACT|nr:hypothetical protein [Thermalbibacter longus]MCM8749489.1 lactonase family protein [Thermalbibacter longus]
MIYRVRSLVAVVLILALVAGLSIVAAMAAGRHELRETVAEAEPVALPDTLLFSLYDQQTGRSSLAALVPGHRLPQPILETAGFYPPTDAAISPDGRQLVVRQVEDVGGRQVGSVIALATDTLETQWRAEVMEWAASAGAATPDSGPVDERPQLMLDSVAVTADRVYVAGHVWQGTNSITVAVLDRATGAEVARWVVDTGERAPGYARLLASPDGGRLVVLASTWDALPTDRDPAGEEGPILYTRLRLPEGIVEARTVVEAQPGTVPLWDGRPTPDGRWLYGLVYTGGSEILVNFFDLASGELGPSLDLAFSGAGGFPISQHAVSPDGRRLYVFSPATGEMAIVDLERQQIEGKVVVETGAEPAGTSRLERFLAALRGLLVREAAAKVSFAGGGMQLSPDGSRLYAIGFEGEAYQERVDGIWVIDTASWRIVGHWLPGASPGEIFLSQDGRFLYAQIWDTGAAQSQSELSVIDTITGFEVFTVPIGASSVTTLNELYRQSIGRAPAGGTLPRSAPADARPIAALAASVEPARVPIRQPVTIEARFVDPATAQPLRPGQDDVRYDPPDRVTASLSYRGADDLVTVELEPAGYARYRGQVALEKAGPWTLTVVAERVDSFNSRAYREAAVTVLPTFNGTDGRAYLLRITTDPERPLAHQRVVFRLAFVDAETGEPLPPDVTVTEGLSSEAFAPLASFYLGIDGGATTGRLEPVGHGVYEGQVTFWEAGTWSVEVRMRRADGHLVPLIVGTIEVDKQ